MIAIIDYGMGNIRSVRNACEALGANAELTDDPNRLAAARGLILPGVGAFGDGMAALRGRGLVDVLNEQVLVRGKPLLGLCLGMQMLATKSTEHGVHDGLGWISGKVDLMDIPRDHAELHLPHIGWNTVRFIKRDGLYGNMGEQADFYFVHSYAFVPDDRSVISGESEHGIPFVASIEHKNIWATQFHPEKSHKNGLALFANWLRRVAAC